MNPLVTIHFDGACEPTNPGGYMIWAYAVGCVGRDDISGVGVVERNPKNTNNVAEWLALHNGVARVTGDAAFAGCDIHIVGDSKLVINQLRGDWACNNERLAAARNRVRELLKGWKFCSEWVPREQNERADALGREAYLRATGLQMPDRTKWKRTA